METKPGLRKGLAFLNYAPVRWLLRRNARQITQDRCLSQLREPPYETKLGLLELSSQNIKL
jgi:hypothetical protein